MSDNLNKSENKKIEPSILAGFQEYLPREQMLFTKMLDIIKKSFESYGFIPLDTPVLEKADILLAKSGGETGKQIYRFEKGDTDMAMRFDLTVPLARYVAQHCGELVFPFRRYHIGKVYRGERPQKGRFREFYQCDIDIVGSGSLSLLSEAEIVSVINATFEALNIGEFTIMINNRKLLGGYFASLGVDDPTEALRIVDKLDKIGAEKVRAELCELGLSPDAAASILNVTSMCGAPAEVLDKLEAMRADVDNELFDTGLDELRRVCTAIREFGVPASRFAVNLKIARGLDYYTGTVYETLLVGYPELGSICSGGRYEDLASNYTKQKLPGVGISIGLSRLFYQLNAAGIINMDGRCTPSRVLFVPMGDTLGYTLELARQLRSRGIPCETYLNEGKAGKKFGYADKLGIPYAVVIGEDERAAGTLSVKNMKTGEQTVYGSIGELADALENE
ncbi:MAG: histidine--tRNA ligase [Clostridia bacterium]|nr:histidine--tRNA ligase [Clostridia bacterium]